MFGHATTIGGVSPDKAALIRFAAMVAVGVGSGVGVIALALPPKEAAVPAVSPEPPVLRIGGQLLEARGEAAVGGALDLVRRYAQGDLALELPDGRKIALKRSSLGAEIDRSHLASLVKDGQDPASPLRRIHQREKPGEPLDLPIPISIKPELATAKLVELKAEIDTAASDARVDLVQKRVVPEKIGFRLDVFATLARIDAAVRSGEAVVQAAVERIEPKLAAAKLGGVKFDKVLGWFETRYTQGNRFKDRTYNLRLAASKLDGTVILPGEIFDFNGKVGPRDEAHGYRVAPVIAEGELVDGIGGGTCQISGTLHGAAFFAGLEVVERSPHSRPSWYIKLGLDATVVYPNINFRFRNPFDFPVVLHETVADGVVRAEILGPERSLTVSYFRRIDEILPYEEIERQTPRLPEGVRVLAQRGIPGFKTTSSRVVRDGAYAVREKWTDHYPPTQQVVHVGTGPKELEQKAKDDTHPEYVADEYLVITQGPDVKGQDGMTEMREVGKSGGRGWTEKMGMPAWRGDLGAKDDDPAAKGEDKDKGKKGEDKDKGKKGEDRDKGKKGEDKGKKGDKKDPKKGDKTKGKGKSGKEKQEKPPAKP